MKELQIRRGNMKHAYFTLACFIPILAGFAIEHAGSIAMTMGIILTSGLLFITAIDRMS